MDIGPCPRSSLVQNEARICEDQDQPCKSEQKWTKVNKCSPKKWLWSDWFLFLYIYFLEITSAKIQNDPITTIRVDVSGGRFLKSAIHFDCLPQHAKHAIYSNSVVATIPRWRIIQVRATKYNLQLHKAIDSTFLTPKFWWSDVTANLCFLINFGCSLINTRTMSQNLGHSKLLNEVRACKFYACSTSKLDSLWVIR